MSHPTTPDRKSVDDKLLYYLQRFKFLTAGMAQILVQAETKAEQPHTRLPALEKDGLVAGFGGGPLFGEAKSAAKQILGIQNSQKVWYLKEPGYAYLAQETEFPISLLGPYRERNTPKWSKHMPHRLKMIEVAIAFDRALYHQCRNVVLERIYFDFDRAKDGTGKLRNDTEMGNGQMGRSVLEPDLTLQLALIEEEEIQTPDGPVFRERRTRRRLPIEVDCQSVTILHEVTNDPAYRDLATRYALYDQLLMTGDIQDLAAENGVEDSFVLLTVAPSWDRVNEIRRKLVTKDINPANHRYFRFSTFDQVAAQCLGHIWQTRNPNDTDPVTALEA